MTTTTHSEAEQPLFAVRNHHVPDCGTPPLFSIENCEPDENRQYFANKYGEQWVFSAKADDTGDDELSAPVAITLRGGDVGWDRVMTVKRLFVSDILNGIAAVSHVSPASIDTFFSAMFATLVVTPISLHGLLELSAAIKKIRKLPKGHNTSPAMMQLLVDTFPACYLVMDPDNGPVTLNRAEGCWLYACMARFADNKRYSVPTISKEEVGQMLMEHVQEESEPGDESATVAE